MAVAMIDVVIRALLFILPAYIANSSAALFGGGRPLDLGRKMGDGRRILGSGKTFRGLGLGIFFGAVAGNVEGYLLQGTQWAMGGVGLYTLLGFLLASGAMLGDLVKSFFKRRLGVKQGAMLPVVDQLDFVAGALLLASPLAFPGWNELVVLVVLTPAVHLFLNWLGYKLKCKKVPW
jgi:CDP-2,3-bis-(O-geranylgeranyl)-sn-glycerol synthase